MPGTDSTYILTPFGDYIKSYGRQNILLMKDSNGNAIFNDTSLTPDNVKEFYQTYTATQVSNATWNRLYATNTAGISQWQQADSNSLTFKPVASIMKLKTIIDDTVDILTTDIVMQVMLKIENALKIATNSKNFFTVKKSNGMSNYNNIMTDIYNNNYNDNSDLSLYDVVTPNGDLSEKNIYFASRAGSFGYTTRKISEYLGSNDEYNGRTAYYYGGEIATEILQNSLVRNIENPLSCGFFLEYDPIPDTPATQVADEYRNQGITNIRFYCSYLLGMGASNMLGLSSGVDLFDNEQIKQFKEGLSSTNFITLLMDICLTLDSKLDELTSQWQFDTISNFSMLKCNYSHSAPYWTDQYIKDCFLRNSTIDIPKRIYNIILYINTNYPIITNNQFILLTYADGAEKIVSIIQIFKSKINNKITFQTKDVRLDNLFPIQNTKSDMIITGELQIENFNNETLLHVDPVTDSVNIMGKLGINQELHEIEGMVDIDNLSNSNMKDFIDNFSPLILDSINKISDGNIVTNSYNLNISDDIRGTSIEQQYIHLEIYKSQPIVSGLSREERFALLQASVEGPMRVFVSSHLTNVLGKLDDSIRTLYANIDTLNREKAKKIEDEKKKAESEKFWDDVILGAAAIIAVVTVIVSAGAAAGAFGPALVSFGEAGSAIMGALTTADSFVGSQVNFTASIVGISDLTSAEIQSKITQANNMLTGMKNNRSELKIQIAKFTRDTTQMEKLTQTSDNFDKRALTIQRYNDLLQLQVITLKFYTNVNNMNVKVPDFFNRLTDITNPNSLSYSISDSFEVLINEIKQQYPQSNLFTNNKWIESYLSAEIETIKQNLTDTEKQIIADQTSAKYNSKKGGSEYLTKNADLTKRINDLQYNLDEYNYRNTAKEFLYTLLAQEKSTGLWRDSYNRIYWTVPNVYFIISEIIYGDSSSEHLGYYILGLYRDQIFGNYVQGGEWWATGPQRDGAQYWMEGDGLKKMQDYIATKNTPTFTTSENTILTYADIYGEMAEYIVDNGYRGIAKYDRKLQGGFDTARVFKYGNYWNWIDILSNAQCSTRFSMNCPTSSIANAYSFFNQREYTPIETTSYNGDKTELDRLLTERANLVDDLQEFTSNNNWDAATHNLFKQLITNTYKLSQLGIFEVDGEKDTLSSEMAVVLPVTDKDDKVTSIYYVKMIYNKFDNDESITMAGRSLNVDEFTRDKSYRDTLFKLMGSLTSASQLINYGYLLFQKNYTNILNTTTTLSKLIKDNMVFVDRFGNGSLQLIVEDLTNNIYVQHEEYPHWVNHSFASLYYPESNMTAQQVNKIIMNEFITQYGFTPYNAKDNTLHPSSINTFIVPYKYDEIWRLYVMKFLKQDDKCYSVSCSISVNNYISQSIIAKGDSTFYGDITVKSTDETRIFQIDTLNKTVSNMYPLGIGTQHPSTMVEVDDTSINNINQLIDNISLRMNYMNKIYHDMNSIELTSIIDELKSSSSTNGVAYMMEVGRINNHYDTSAANTNVMYLRVNDTIYTSNTTPHTLQTLRDDPTYTGMSAIIDKYVIPEVQSIINNTLFYNRSVSSFVSSGINGAKYSILQTIVLNSTIYIIVCEWNIQKYRINIIHNPNIKKLFNYTDSMITFMNYIKQKQLSDSNQNLDIGIKDLSTIVSELRGEYPELTKSIYEYDLSNTLTNSKSYLENQVREVSIDTDGGILYSDSYTTINDKLESAREKDLSFIMGYLKYYKTSLLKKGDMGMLNVQNSNYYYSVIFYHTSEVEIVAFYINVTELFMTAAVSIHGDMALSGELTMYKQPLENSVESNANKYITIDPQTGYLGINTNERFINYALDYTTTSSAYNSKHHAVAFSKSYPNFAFERLAETDDDTDYSKFGSYSASTMVRVSELWNYDEIIARVGKLNEENSSPFVIPSADYTNSSTWPDKTVEYKEDEFNWRLHKTYGPDISFEVKDKMGLTTELGEVKMVIDSKDENGHIHAGFGVQVIDNNLSGTFDSSLKNIMYVNNQKQMFIDGVWLGGKLLREVGGKLKWGKNTVNLTEE